MATKAEIIEELKAAEIDFDESMTKGELEALLPEAEEEETATGDSVTVTGRTARGMAVTRVYSKEVHGDDFMDLAKEAAEKFEGTIA